MSSASRGADSTDTEHAERRLSVVEAARELGVIPRTVLNWIHAGRLAALKPGGAWQIPRSEVARLLEPVAQPGVVPRRRRMTSVRAL